MQTVLEAEDTKTLLAVFAYLKEALQPPDLEDTLGNKDSHLEYGPPLDTLVGRLGGVAVDALTENDVGLLVLDLCEELGKSADCT